MKNKIISFIMGAILINLLWAGIFFTDRYVKSWKLENPQVKQIFRIGSVSLDTVLYKNEKLAFSIPFPATMISIVVLLILAIIFFILAQAILKKDLYLFSVLSLIIWGAVSNLMDRFSNGAVIDYLDIMIWKIDWPVFNIADIMVVFGILIWLFRGFGEQEKIVPNVGVESV